MKSQPLTANDDAIIPFRAGKKSKSKAGQRPKNRRSLPNSETLEQRIMMAGDILSQSYHGHFLSSSHYDGLTLDIRSGLASDGSSRTGGLVGIVVQDADGAKVVDPASVRIVPNALNPARSVLERKDLRRRSASLTIAEVSTGPFSLMVTPERGTSGAYSVSTYLVGDVDANGLVDSSDIRTIEQALRNRRMTVSQYPGADTDLDGRITRQDLRLARQNLGSSLQATLSNPQAFQVPAGSDDRSSVRFTLEGRESGYRDEFGVFLVDDAHGRIGALKPGDAGYLQAALAAERRSLLFGADQGPGGTASLNLKPGQYFGTFIVANGTLQEWLADPQAGASNQPLNVYLSFAAANADRYPHVLRMSQDGIVLGLEDLWHGGDRDHNDMTVRIEFIDPLADPTLKGITLALDPAFDSAPVGDGITNIDRVDFVGRIDLDPADAPAGGYVVTLSGPTDTVLGSTSTSPDGTYRFQNIPLTFGVQDYTVRVTDKNGNARTATLRLEYCGFGPDLTSQGWTTTQTGGTPGDQGTVTVVGDHVRLVEGDSFQVVFEKSFVIPADGGMVGFEYANLAFDTSAPGFINDAFEVALLGDNGQPLVPTFTPGRDAFFNVTEGLNIATGTGVILSGSQVMLDLAGQIPGTTARLVFRLVNNDADTTTSVEIVCAKVPATASSANGQTASTLSVPADAFATRTTASTSSGTDSSSGSGTVSAFASPLGEFGPQALSPLGDTLLDDQGRAIFTTSDDFRNGSLFNLNLDEVPDEFRLNSSQTIETYPFIWIANSGEGTVSRLDTRTGTEVGRYRVGANASTNPSRVAVTPEGDVWVANRGDNPTIPGNVVKILGSGFIDRNGNGVMDTAVDLNGDGYITGTEILPWDANGDGQPDDERIALVIHAGRNRNNPSQFIYEGGARGVALDSYGKLWVGLYSHRQYEVFDATTGEFEKVVPVNGAPYGAVIAPNGILYSVIGGNRYLDAIDTKTQTYNGQIDVGSNTYGITIDRQAVVWLSPYLGNQLVRFDTNTGEVVLYPSPEGADSGAGIAVDRNGNVWAGRYNASSMMKWTFEDDTKTLVKSEIVQVPGGSATKSASIDSDGFVWTVALNSSKAFKIDPVTNQVILERDTGTAPYNYSDMTGDIRIASTERTGTWTEILDGGRPGVPWATVSLLQDLPPETSSRLRVRASDDRSLLPAAAWQELPHDTRFEGIVGRYLEVEVALRSRNPQATPSVQEIFVQSVPLPTVEVELPAEVAAGTSLVLSGLATAAQPVLPSGAVVRNAITHVTVNGKPVDLLDSAGRFFMKIDVLPGVNRLEVAAYDIHGQAGISVVEIEGTQRADDEVDFSKLSDITASFAVEYARTSFFEDDLTIFADVAVRNVGQYPVDAPLYVAIANLSRPDVMPRGAKGYTPDGLPFYDVSDLVPGGRLGSQSVTDTLAFAFFNPSESRFTYDLKFFGLLNRAPQITTVPVVEAFPGRTYRYDVNAVDPDADPVRFALVTAPASMTIDPVTGVISWTPSETSLGAHPLVVWADDGRGGFTEQRFTVDVTVAPPNRPPVFTSLPVVSSYVGVRYVYDADAVDPDLDTLTYSLVAPFPDGMTIDRNTGQIVWTPSASQQGEARVTVEAKDGFGGDARQTFDLCVLAAPGNNAPVIVSQPVTIIYLRDSIGRSSGEFGAPVNPGAYGITSHNGGTRNRIFSGDGSNYIQFDGVVFQTKENGIVRLGSMTFQNGTVYGSYFSGDFPLKVNLFLGESSSLSGEFNFVFNWINTPNTGSDIDNADRLAISNSGNETQTFEYNGKRFKIELIGFSQDGGNTVGSQFSVLEGARTSSDLYARIVEVSGGTGEQSEIYRYDVEAIDPDLDTVSYRIIEGPIGATIDQQNGAVIWAPSLNQVGTQQFVISATDGRGGIHEQQFLVQVTTDVPTPVDPPIQESGDLRFVLEPVKNVTCQELYRFTAEVEGGDLATRRFDLPAAPAGMTVHPTLGVVVWTPTADQVGSHQVVLRVQDGKGGVALQNFAIEVAAPNAAPIVSSTPPGPATVGLPYEYAIQAQDAEGDALSFRLLSPLGSNLTLSPDGVLRFTPVAGQVGNVAVKVAIDAAAGPGVDYLFTVPVVATSTNAAPVIRSTPGEYATLGMPYAYQILADDANGDPLTFELVDGPANLTINKGYAPDGSLINAPGLVVWQPDAQSAGSVHAVIVRVSDGRGGVVTQEFAIEVRSQGSNLPPKIVSVPLMAATVDRGYKLDMKAVDPDGDVLSWILAKGPRGMSIDPRLGTLRWTPSADQLGPQEVVVEVMDPFMQKGTQRFTILVTCRNQGPQILSRPVTVAYNGEPYVYAVRADDPENDVLAFRFLSTVPQGMTIDRNTGLIRWTPSVAAATAIQVAIEVSDGQGNVATQSYMLETKADPRNRPPVITSQPRTGATAGGSYEYQVTARDADGDTLRYELVSGPAGNGMAIDEKTGLLTWSPTMADLGEHVVTLAAIDSNNARALQTYLLKVAVNQAPSITSAPVTSAPAGGTYGYDVRAVDPDGDALTYTLAKGPAGMTVDNFGRIRWQPSATYVSGNPEPVEIVVSDPQGLQARQAFAVTVVADTEAPRVNVTFSTNLSQQGDTVRFRIMATDNIGVVSMNLTLGGQPLVLDSGGYATNVMAAPELYPLVGTATDAAGNVGTWGPFDIRVFDPGDQSSPVVTILSPDPAQPNTTITYLTEIRGSVIDDNLEFWSLDFARADKVNLDQLITADGDDFAGWTNIASGRTNVGPAVLGTFDPTVLLNGPYVIRLMGQDVNGLKRAEVALVNVAGEAKVGNFAVEFTDLQVPLAGIPITVVRSYDTLKAGDEGDFGFGWSLGLRDARILESAAIGEGGAFNPGNDKLVPGYSKVYLTNPEGRRVGFTYREQLISASFFGGIWRPYFEADPGVYDTLTIDEKEVARGGIVGALAQGINPDIYTLTTPDGTKYRYDQTQGLQRIDTLNGQTVTFSKDGILHSSGARIAFARDHRGRITEIVQYDFQGIRVGEPVKYSYDAAGDLKTVTDQANLTTRYVYETSPAHFLKEAFDSNNVSVLKVIYENNRFVRIVDALGKTIDQRDYDLESRTAIIRDANNNETTLIYDDRGNVITETDALGKTIIREYADPKNPTLETKIIDKLGNVTERAYDARGNVLTIRETGSATAPLADPVLTTFTYDTRNNVTTITNDLGRATTFGYDSKGNLLTITNALGHSSSFTYDSQGRKKTFTDFNNNTTTFEYKSEECGCSNPSKTIFADGTYQLMKFNQYGQVTEDALYEKDGRLVEITSTTYDALGRELTVTRGQGVDAITTKKFYKNDRLDYEMVVNPASPNETRDTPVAQRKSRIAAYDYDDTGRLVRHVNPDGGIVEFRYDAQGNRVLMMDPVGNVTTWVYDGLNRVAEERDPFFWRIHTENIPVGQINIDAIVSANMNPSGASVVTNTPAPHVRVFGYDAEGNQNEIIDRNGRRREFEYDHDGRMIEERWYEGTSTTLLRTMTWRYDTLGNLMEAFDPDSHYRYTYDTLNRVTSEENNPFETLDLPRLILSYQYDKQGNVISTSDNFGVTVASEYDERNRLAVRTWFDATPGETPDVDPVRIDFAYNAAGRQSVLERRGSLTAVAPLLARTTTSYHISGLTDRLRHANAVDEVLASYEYGYDYSGLVISEDRNHEDLQYRQTIDYGYDLNGQLIKADFDTQPDEAYLYDLNGNRIRSESHLGVYLYQTGLANQLLFDGRHQFEYDDEGNLIRQSEFGPPGPVVLFRYDHRNRLIAVDRWSRDPSQDGAVLEASTSYHYDVFGRRIVIVEDVDAAGPTVPQSTLTFYNINDAWADLDPSWTIRARYLFGNGIDNALARSTLGDGLVWYISDQQGTARDLANADGALSAHTDYSSFGTLLTQSGSVDFGRYQFTGREIHSQEGLYYYRARFYDPATGRFLSRDPRGFEAGDVNLYRYVGNSPANYIDPRGEAVFTEFGVFLRSLVARATIVRCLGIGAFTLFGEAGIYILLSSIGPAPGGPSNVYVGRTVDFAVRFYQHDSSGVGGRGLRILSQIKIKLPASVISNPEAFRTAEQLVMNAFGGKARLLNIRNASRILFCR